MKKKKLAIIILLTILIGILVFAYFFFLRQNPVNLIRSINPLQYSKPPGFLYAINSEPDHPLDSPMAVYVFNNKIFVSDTGVGKVLAYDYNGKFQQYLQPGQGSFRAPYGMADDGTNLYVADISLGKIFVFNSGGTYKKQFSVKGAQLGGPGGLYFKGGKLYVSDLQKQMVFAFDLDGNLLKAYGREGHGSGELSFPNGITVDDQGTVYTADSGNNRIAVFNADGSSVERGIGAGDPGNSNMLTPRGLQRDSNGNLWMAMGLANQIQVLAPDGRKLLEFGHDGKNYGDIALPNGVFIDKNNRVYVTEVGNSRVSVFGY